MRRIKLLFGALALLCAVILGGGPATTANAASTATAWGLPAGIDLHDGSVAHFGNTFYAYGTRYGCGFQWSHANTPWCGVGVSTAPSLAGPWSTPTLLFSPTDIDPYTGTTWNVECGGTGAGCYNARMLQRTGWGANDGVFVLWLNSPADYVRDGSNAYNALGCNGPAGPCGPSAGAPHGSYTKPSLTHCAANGDFGFISDVSGQPPALVCAGPGGGWLGLDQIDQWGVNGSGTGTRTYPAPYAEGDGGYYDAASGKYVITYAEPPCGYCAGGATGYETATSLYGTWTSPTNVAAADAPPGARRDFSAGTCGGQARTVSVVDGVPYQGIDLWTGSANETNAGVHYEPLTFNNPSGHAGDGLPWQPFAPFTCV